MVKHIYAHFDLIDGKLGNPFYIGISKNPHSDPNGIFIGKGKKERLKYFIESPYIRRCDFGRDSIEGYKAEITFDNPTHKCNEYSEYLKNKAIDVDFTSRVIFESEDWDYINFMEYCLVKHYGLRKNGGLLFNKIPGGHGLEDGHLIKRFKYDEERCKFLENIIIEYFVSGKELEHEFIR